MGDRTINGHPNSMGYAHVSIDTILDKKYNKMDIDYPAQDDRQRLVQNKGALVAWPKRFIRLDHQLSSNDDEDDDESSLPRDDHSPSPNRGDHTTFLGSLPSPLRR